MNVLVTGGTGVLGRHVVAKLRHQGHHVRVLTRHPNTDPDAVQGDLATGAGIVQAVEGIDTIVHAASATTQLTKAHTIDVVGTRRLLAMAREAGVKHAVYVSIVGIDGVGYPYYRAKLAAEAVVEENIVPWSILRATQFHPLMETFLEAFSKPPFFAAIPFAWQFQPVDPREVADRLVDTVASKPAGRVPDFGGPEARNFKSIAESWLKARKLNKRLIPLPIPLELSRQVASGCLLAPQHRDGKITFEQYLEEKYPA